MLEIIKTRLVLECDVFHNITEISSVQIIVFSLTGVVLYSTCVLA